jgi:alpha-N-arabinofuranosidase
MIRFLLALAVAAMAGLQPAGAQALLRNGDFAAGGVPPAEWSLDPATAAKGRMRLVGGPAGTPGRVLELSPNARNTPSATPYGVGQLLPAAAVRGRRLAISASLGATGAAQAVLGLAVLRRGGEAGSVILRSAAADGTLATEQGTLEVPDDAAVEGAVLFLVAEGTSGSALFAAVSVTAGAPPRAAAPPAPAARAAAPAPPRAAAARDIPARVRIDTGAIRRTIPREIFGTNVEIIRDANGLWDARRNRLDPDVVRMAREMGITLVRFPGGVWSDAYDWRHGIGPPSARATTPMVPGDTERVRHVFGTDEALAFAREIGGSLLITVNAGSGTAQLAADWVRYVNGEGGRSPRNGRVTWWEIGNELYMAGDSSGGATTPRRYADRVVEFARAMRAVDPGIRIAAIGLRNFGRYRFNSHDDWNEVVLRRAGEAIDLLAVHNAYAPVIADARGLDALDVYAAMWAFPQLVARNLADTRAEIARFAPARADRIGIGVTEWGPLFGIDPASPLIDHVKTIGSAIYVASVLRVFAEDPSVMLANFFKLNESLFMGWIGRRGDTWAMTAPAMAFGMIARGMEGGLLATATEVATYRSRPIGFMDGVAAAPFLDVLASATPDRRTATVLLINRHPNAGIATRVTLGGAAGAAALTTETLVADAPDAHTGTELLRIPGLRWGEQARAGAQGRFHLGAEREVRIERAAHGPTGAEHAVRVPPHAIMLLRFEGLRAP